MSLKAKDFAFPFSVLPDKYQPMLVTGLTKREYFAACAITAGYQAPDAVKLADELLEELKKEKSE